MGKWRLAFTRSRRSLPGLKCGTYLPDSATASPVLGFRPMRGGRKCKEKLPNPLISIRSPFARESLIRSRRCFTASSTSFEGRCFCLREIPSISSDFVILPITVPFYHRNPRILKVIIAQTARSELPFLLIICFRRTFFPSEAHQAWSRQGLQTNQRCNY